MADKKKEETDEPVVADKDAFEDEPEEHAETSEELEQKFETGEKEADVDSEEGRESLEDDDEIKSDEAGFSKGASSSHHH